MTILLTTILATIETGTQAGRFTEEDYLVYSKLLMTLHNEPSHIMDSRAAILLLELIDKVKFMHERDIISDDELIETHNAIQTVYYSYMDDDAPMVTVEDGYEYLVVE
jgi:hypothetical protein